MRKSDLKIPFAFAVAKLLLHLLTNREYGFHRDELLYLELGRHLDWGYWSNPPMIGLISYCNQLVLGDGLFATRLVPALFGSAVLFLICLMARDLGGRRSAQVLAGIAGFSSLAYLRSSHMFQPVIIDVFFWTLVTWIIIRYLQSHQKKWLLVLGLALGLGFLNKYSVAFLIAALILSFLVTQDRKVFLQRYIWLGAGLALLVVLPNLIWQWQNDFPVVSHMTELAENQLSNVNPFVFLLDQLLMHFTGFLIWIPGLLFLLLSKRMKPYRSLGWIFIFTLGLFLLMSGKSYYTLGTFPVLMAAGGVFWEQYFQKSWKIIAIAGLVLLGNIPLLPAGLPILSLPNAAAYFKVLVNDFGIDSLTRWEGGSLESLPQDYADMLGWEEIAQLVDLAIETSGNPDRCLIYGESYGQAAAVAQFSKYPQAAHVASFSDTYRLWVPTELPAAVDQLIYINDELGEDVAMLFTDVQLIGEIDQPLSRQRGNQVYLCRKPRSGFSAFWQSRVETVLRRE